MLRFPPRLTLWLLPLLLGIAPALHAAGMVTVQSTPLTAEDARALPAIEGVDFAAQVDMPAPPSPLRSPQLVPTGQVNLLGLAETAPQEVTLFSYNTITGVWAEFGRAQLDRPIAAIRPTTAGFVIEDTAGAFTRLEVTMARRLLLPIDWIVLFGYLAAMAGIGWWCYRREKRRNTTDYFLAGRDIPFWAAGLSLYATGTSAISFVAIPAKSFATNWVYLAQNFVAFAGIVYVAWKIIPLIRRLGLTSVYHYLEMRFHPSVRLMSSGLNIVFQLAGRMSIVLYLPALAISGVTGMDVLTSVILMGVVTTLYTVMGGMKAVIWTDVIQVFVMIGGALFAIGYVINGIDGGVTRYLEIAQADRKMHTFDFDLNLVLPTVWAFLLLELVNVPTWPKDQVMMQRVLSTRNDREASSSVLTLAVVVIPGSILFYSIGTALYVFYKEHPERLNPLLSVDATFPHFIAAELPAGITGLIIAGLFAASMSTLSSGINSVATMFSVDFYERLKKNVTPAQSMRVAVIVTIISGVIGTGFAVILTFFEVMSIFDVSLQLTAMLGGGFAGTYALGMFTRRANWQGALIGTAASIACAFLLKPIVSPILLPGVAIAACIVVGYIASYFFPASAQSLLGLTIYTPRRASA